MFFAIFSILSFLLRFAILSSSFQFSSINASALCVCVFVCLCLFPIICVTAHLLCVSIFYGILTFVLLSPFRNENRLSKVTESRNLRTFSIACVYFVKHKLRFDFFFSSFFCMNVEKVFSWIDSFTNEYWNRPCSINRVLNINFNRNYQPRQFISIITYLWSGCRLKCLLKNVWTIRDMRIILFICFVGCKVP